MKETIQIVGTSKSKSENGYYFDSKEKFWGLVEKSKIGKRYEPLEFNQFTNETGIGFCELVFDNIISNDKKIKEELDYLRKGIPDFITYLKGNVCPNQIVFNGKSAAGWFFQYIDTGDIDKSPAKYLKKIFPEFKYGLCERGFNGIKIWILPNTSGAANATWDSKPWLDFWNSI